MEIKVPTSRVFRVKGKILLLGWTDAELTRCRFGWVNASYVYGLQLINAHMKRALGAITPFDSFTKATEALGID
jgi:hypothetical protein